MEMRTRLRLGMGGLLVAASVACGGAAATAQAAGTATPAGSFENPVLWEDLPDLDIFRVGDTFYYSASTMHYSPGAPVLRSKDLVHWQYAGHSVPVLDFSPAYDLKGGNAYVKGVWASFLGYRPGNKTFYWGGCIGFAKTYLYTATAVEGPWARKAVLNQCYYDAGLLVDQDDTMYVAYGRGTLHVAQLSADGAHEVRSQEVFKTPAEGVDMLEGSRFYRVNGNYYILADRPPNGEFVLKSTTGPFGPYTMQKLVLDAKAPIAGGGSPHQGGLVQTQHGDWYYMGFVDAYPGGRVPVLAPVTWSADGWPVLRMTDNAWERFYPNPLPPQPQKDSGVETFEDKALGPEWEWNHNPDNSRWSLHDGLRLETATVTDDLYAARNTLTHRTVGPASTATVMMDTSAMKDGDRAGLVMLRDSSAWVGVERDGDAFKVVMRSGLIMKASEGSSWQTISTGSDIASAPVARGKIWLRAMADVRPGVGRTAIFFYSVDGLTFKPLGTPFVLNTDWHFFMGYRYGLFNYATRTLGGAVTASSFTVTTP